MNFLYHFSLLKHLVQSLICRDSGLIYCFPLLFDCLEEELDIFLGVECQAKVRLKRLCLVCYADFTPRGLF